MVSVAPMGLFLLVATIYRGSACGCTPAYLLDIPNGINCTCPNSTETINLYGIKEL